MIYLNTTIQIDTDIHEVCLLWIQEKYIPKVMELGKFSHAKLMRVEIPNDVEGYAYAVQFTAESKEQLEFYYAKSHLADQWLLQKFQKKALSFSTELELIERYNNE